MFYGIYHNFGVIRPDSRSVGCINSIASSESSLVFNGLIVRQSDTLPYTIDSQKIKTWKHRSLKRPFSRRVYNYTKARHAILLDSKVLLVSKELYDKIESMNSVGCCNTNR